MSLKFFLVFPSYLVKLSKTYSKNPVTKDKLKILWILYDDLTRKHKPYNFFTRSVDHLVVLMGLSNFYT